jgi:hypothetical protein
MICVMGVMVPEATAAFMTRRRSWLQAHDPPGHHVLLDGVGQFVGCALAGHGQLVQPLAQGAHDEGHRRKQDRHEQRELPVQPQQVHE